MNKIILLDELTINKIAAGEVVERPASVVKELVENSIDANAKRITVEVQDGGTTLISVSDDGDGILPEDIPLAFQRHSTSKLKTVDDISRLFSNGFRGEALSSISSVSRVEISTNTDDSYVGKKAVVSDGMIQKIQDIGTKKGTTIKVQDLFYNTPARRKFLKSGTAENLQITDILSRLAVINNSIAIKYISNGREVFETHGDSKMLNAIGIVYGKTVATNLLPINYQSNISRISGYVSNTSLYHSNRKKENIFVNKRYIKTSNLNYVIENIYKDIIPIGKYPVFFVNIEIDPQYIDPNVHPAKLEIKISNDVDIALPLGDAIRSAIFSASRNLIPNVSIKSSVSRGNILENLYIPENPESVSGKRSNDFEKIEERNIKGGFLQEFGEKSEQVPKNTKENYRDKIGYENKKSEYANEENLKRMDNIFVYEEFEVSSNNPQNEEVVYHKTDTNQTAVIGRYKKENLGLEGSVGRQENFLHVDNKNFETENAIQTDFFEDSDEILDYCRLNIIGIVMGTYIVVTYKESMFLVDQHAAHERVLFEYFLEKLNFSGEERFFETQELLVADIKEFSATECEIILKNSKLFESLGYVIDDFGFNRIAIRTYPIIFEKTQGINFFNEITDAITEEKKLDLNENFWNKIAKMACKNAIKANQKIGEEEIKLLFEKLNKCKNKYTCPHGRPIFIEFKKYEIEKMFKRIV